MKMRIEFENKPTLTIKYEAGEWEQIEKFYVEELKLEEKKTDKAFGGSNAVSFYQAKNADLAKFLINAIKQNVDYQVLDDLNNYLIPNSDYVNIAILRVKPKDSEVSIELEKFLTIADVNMLSNVLSDTIETMLNVVVNKEVKFKVVE